MFLYVIINEISRSQNRRNKIKNKICKEGRKKEEKEQKKLKNIIKCEIIQDLF